MNFPNVRRCLSAILLILVAGCESQVVASKGDRKPTTPSEVKIYQQAPKQYELLATVEVPVGGDVRWDAKADATAGFDKLKSQAANKGANGILLTADDPNASVVIAGCNGKFYQVPLRPGSPSAASAKAIYVLKE